MFIDANLPPALAFALDKLTQPEGHSVSHLTQRFSRSTPDHEWISALATEGEWIVITQDRFKKNDLEKKVFRESGLTAFFLMKGWSSLTYWEKSWKLVRWWPAVIDQAERVQPGASFEIPVNFSGNGKFRQYNY
nr:hypothetical protein [Wenzhouxiangella limi]